MSLPPILLPEAKTDVADAYLWYEDQSLGLGMEFLRCVEGKKGTSPFILT